MEPKKERPAGTGRGIEKNNDSNSSVMLPLCEVKPLGESTPQNTLTREQIETLISEGKREYHQKREKKYRRRFYLAQKVGKAEAARLIKILEREEANEAGQGAG